MTRLTFNIAFVFFNLLSISKMFGQCINVSSFYENTLFRGIDNVIYVEYDTVSLYLHHVEASNDTGFHFKKMINGTYSVATSSNRDISLQFVFKNKLSGIEQFQCHTFQVKPLTPQSLLLDSYKSGDTLRICELGSLNGFIIEFKPNITLHRYVHSLETVFEDNKFTKIEFNKQEGFAGFRDSLIKEIKNRGTLVLYDIIVQVEGKRFYLNPIQLVIVE
jgi:hypothetical protein